MEGNNELNKCNELRTIQNNCNVSKIMANLFGAEEDKLKSFEQKWLRGVAREGFTGAHVDWVQMGKGTKNMQSCWTALGDNTMELGGLAILSGSNNFSRLETDHLMHQIAQTYCTTDLDDIKPFQGTGWLTEDPLELIPEDYENIVWRTADQSMGDIVVFRMDTFHMSTVNVTDRLRFSCDTRWMLAADKCDPRFSGDDSTDSK